MSEVVMTIRIYKGDEVLWMAAVRYEEQIERACKLAAEALQSFREQDDEEATDRSGDGDPGRGSTEDHPAEERVP